MYDNIGRKIKGLASGFFISLAVIGVVIGIITILAFEGAMVIIGLLMLIFVPILSLVLSWLIYGFGELIENQCATMAILEDIRDGISEKTTETNCLAEEIKFYKYDNSSTSFCKNCNTEQPDNRTVCWKCGRYIIK